MLISRPADSTFSHKNSSQQCIQHAKQWLANSDMPLDLASNVTYAELRAKLNKIIKSGYFIVIPEIKSKVDIAAALSAADVVLMKLNYESKSCAYEWFCLKSNKDASQKPPICKCAAMEDLHDPVFFRPHKYRPESSIAVVGSMIYVFGDADLVNNCAGCTEVSYIDTIPNNGWKICQNPIPKGRMSPYSIALDDKRVLLLGGDRILSGDQTYAQMYNPIEDTWVVLENYPTDLPSMECGHADIDEETVLIHGMGCFNLYTYNVKTDSWGIRWGKESEFANCYHSGALVDGIYYVLNMKKTRGTDGGGGWDLVAEPLSHVSYHVNNGGRSFHTFVPMLYSYGDQL